jgi:hypothetical protein
MKSNIIQIKTNFELDSEKFEKVKIAIHPFIS